MHDEIIKDEHCNVSVVCVFTTGLLKENFFYF